MTTIVYKDGLLAADGRVTADFTIISENYTKLYAIRGETDAYVIGLAGDTQEFGHFTYWATQDFCLSCFPTLPDQSSVIENLSALVIRQSNSNLYLFEGKGFAQLPEKGVAIGSGMDAAMAGLALGLNAEECVELAATIDAATNDTITTWNVADTFNSLEI